MLLAPSIFGTSLRRFSSSARKTTALIMGPPGGGKGTMSKRLIKDFDFHHVSTGDILRENVKLGTELGKRAKTYMENGELLPDDLMVELVATELKDPAVKQRVLLDGFPRTLGQAQALDKQIDVDLALNLDVPFAEIVNRIQNRWTHPASGRVYAYDFNPPKELGIDDVTGEPLIQRDDDKPESVAVRLEAYAKMTSPLVDHYQRQGVLKEFSGDNNPELVADDRRSDAIYQEMKPYLEEKLKEVEA